MLFRSSSKIVPLWKNQIQSYKFSLPNTDIKGSTTSKSSSSDHSKRQFGITISLDLVKDIRTPVQVLFVDHHKLESPLDMLTSEKPRINFVFAVSQDDLNKLSDLHVGMFIFSPKEVTTVQLTYSQSLQVSRFSGSECSAGVKLDGDLSLKA